MASPQRFTHSTLKGPSRESTSERRTVLASAASARIRSTFRDIVPLHTSLYVRNDAPSSLGSQCASVQREAELRHIAVHHAGRSGIVSEDKQESWCHSRRGPPRKISSARRSTRPGSSTSAGTLPAGRAAPCRCVIANGARLARFGAAHHGLCAVLTKQ